MEQQATGWLFVGTLVHTQTGPFVAADCPVVRLVRHALTWIIFDIDPWELEERRQPPGSSGNTIASSVPNRRHSVTQSQLSDTYQLYD